MSFEEALRLIRDPATPNSVECMAGAVLHDSIANLTDDDLLICMGRYRSVAWWAANELHARDRPTKEF